MRILCFGDSNTYGYDPRGFFGDRYGAEDRWVDLPAEKLNISFVDTRKWNIDLTFDGVHFIEEGHHAFAEDLRKELRL